jgi:hypothetical protein
MGLPIFRIVVRICLVPGVRKALISLPREFRHRCVQVLVPTYLAGVEMELVALEAKEGLILLQKVVRNGAVGAVAYGTVFHHRCMLKDKRPLFGGMARETEVVQPFICLEASHIRAMCIMAVRTGHLSFSKGMMGRILHSGLNVWVTTVASVRLCLGQQMLASGRVDLVAVCAAYIIEIVLTACPVKSCVAL